MTKQWRPVIGQVRGEFDAELDRLERTSGAMSVYIR